MPKIATVVSCMAGATENLGFIRQVDNTPKMVVNLHSYRPMRGTKTNE